jgi:hypothetical protein
MSETVHPAASHHLPFFITAPGQTDIHSTYLTEMADAKQSQISIEAPSPRGSGPVIPQLPQQADREQIRLEAEADRSQFS